MARKIHFKVKDSEHTLLQTGQITHVYGPPKSGKSTLTANLAFELVKNGYKVMIISTERPIEIRMESMIKAEEDYTKEMLTEIITTDIFSFDELIHVITKELKKYVHDIDAILIDSLTSSYRFSPGSISLTLLRNALAVLRSIAYTNNKAIFFTNQVSSKMNETNVFRPVASATTRSYSDVTIRLTKKIDQTTEISFEDMLGNELDVLSPIKIVAAGFEDFTHYFTLRAREITHIVY